MAVYTNISSDQLAVFLEDYDLGAYRSHEGIAQGVSNSNFHVFTDKGRYILTLFEKRRDNYDDLPFFFSFAAHVRDKGIICPQALPDRQGNIISELAGRAAVVLNFLEGSDIKPSELVPAHCAQVGALSARLHIAAQDFELSRENTMGFRHWEKLVRKASAYADRFEPGLYDFLCREHDDLTANWPQHLPAGVVHADIFPDNVFFTDDTLTAVIDFYFSCTDYFSFDLAVTVNAWCFAPGDMFDSDRFGALLDAYQRLRPLSAAEKEGFNFLLRGAAFRFLLSRLEEYCEHDDDNTVMTPHDPGEYLRRLRYHQDHDLARLL